MALPRVLLADDHALLLGAYEKLLAGQCEIVGQVSDGRSLVEAAERLRPDLVILDISMPLLNGLEAGRQIKQKLGAVKLVFVTMNEDAELAAEAFRIRGVRLPAEAMRGLRAGHGDPRSHARTIVRHAARHRGAGWLADSSRRAVTGHELTSRQREVLQLLAEGRSMKEVAGVLNLTPRTVAFHKYRMMEQLKLKTTAELIQYAVRHHIV